MRGRREQIKGFSLTAALVEEATDLGDESTAAKTSQGERREKKEVRMTCGDTLWLLPRLDRAGLIMDGLLLLDKGSATESQIWLRPDCLLAARIIGPLMFCSGSQSLWRSRPGGFKMRFLSGEVNSSSSWCFMTDPLLTHGPLAMCCPVRATGWCKQAERISRSQILNCLESSWEIHPNTTVMVVSTIILQPEGCRSLRGLSRCVLASCQSQRCAHQAN